MTESPKSTVLSNRYQIIERLAKGGMSVVYRAQDLRLERSVAIKILRQDFSQDPDFREHFRQEARAAANLSHPNIVTVYDFGLDEDSVFIVMEYVPGTDLKSLLQQRGRFSIDESIQLMAQACAGAGYAHRAGLVHCDIKPQNLLITPDQHLKVVDFGIARAISTIHPDEKMEIVWGSPQYFSPEQAAGLPPSPASDVYSLGIIFYEMLTGELPFKASSSQELARMHRQDLPRSPREINPKIPYPIEQILFMTLAKEPAARYRTADQLGRVLITFQESTKSNNQIIVSQDSVETTNFHAPDATTRYAQASSKINTEGDDIFRLDWITIGLGLLALLAVGGLIPFYIWIYLLYNSPIR